MNKDYLLKATRNSIKTHITTNEVPLSQIKKYAKRVIDINDKYNNHIPQSEINALIADYPKLTSNIVTQLNQETLSSEKEALIELQKLIKSLDK